MTGLRIQYVDTGSVFGGAERITLTLASAFQKEGAAVECVVHPESGRFIDALRERGLSTVPASEADRLSRIPPLAGAIARFRPHIVHIHRTWPLSDRYAAMAARQHGVPMVVTTEHVRYEGCGLRDRTMKRFLAPMDDRIVAVSRSVQRSLRDFWHVEEGRLTVIENGIDTKSFESPSADKLTSDLFPERTEFRIGAVGRLEEQKNFRFLVAAMPAILKAVPGACLVVAGEGSLKSALEAQAADLGIGPSVRWAGSLPAIAPFLAGLDLFVLPSLWEGLPLSLLEAMAAGVPIVATAIDGTTEAVRDDVEALLVPTGDPDTLATSCIRIHKESGLKASLVSNGRRRVKSLYSVDRMVDRYREIYTS